VLAPVPIFGGASGAAPSDVPVIPEASGLELLAIGLLAVAWLVARRPDKRP